MTGKTHVICSVAAFSAVTATVPASIQIHNNTIIPAISLLPAAIGAWLPDMDIQQSRLGAKLRFLSKHMKHRGITHTLIPPAVLYFISINMDSPIITIVTLAAVLYIGVLVYGLKKGAVIVGILAVCTFFMEGVGPSVLFGLASGWLLHIVEDMFNHTGCPVLYPFTTSRVHIPIIAIIKTRHWTEYIFMACWLGGCLLWIFLQTGGI